MNPQSLLQANNFLSTLYSNPQVAPKREVITVDGVNEAQSFRLDKGESVALIDCNTDVLYVKESDEVGKTSLRIYECVDKTEEYLAKNTPAQISKADFDKLQNQLTNLTNLLSRGVPNVIEERKEK